MTPEKSNNLENELQRVAPEKAADIAAKYRSVRKQLSDKSGNTLAKDAGNHLDSVVSNIENAGNDEEKRQFIEDLDQELDLMSESLSESAEAIDSVFKGLDAFVGRYGMNLSASFRTRYENFGSIIDEDKLALKGIESATVKIDEAIGSNDYIGDAFRENSRLFISAMNMYARADVASGEQKINRLLAVLELSDNAHKFGEKIDIDGLSSKQISALYMTLNVRGKIKKGTEAILTLKKTPAFATIAQKMAPSELLSVLASNAMLIVEGGEKGEEIAKQRLFVESSIIVQKEEYAGKLDSARNSAGKIREKLRNFYEKRAAAISKISDLKAAVEKGENISWIHGLIDPESMKQLENANNAKEKLITLQNLGANYLDSLGLDEVGEKCVTLRHKFSVQSTKIVKFAYKLQITELRRGMAFDHMASDDFKFGVPEGKWGVRDVLDMTDNKVVSAAKKHPAYSQIIVGIESLMSQHRQGRHESKQLKNLRASDKDRRLYAKYMRGQLDDETLPLIQERNMTQKEFHSAEKAKIDVSLKRELDYFDNIGFADFANVPSAQRDLVGNRLIGITALLKGKHKLLYKMKDNLLILRALGKDTSIWTHHIQELQSEITQVVAKSNEIADFLRGDTAHIAWNEAIDFVRITDHDTVAILPDMAPIVGTELYAQKEEIDKYIAYGKGEVRQVGKISHDLGAGWAKDVEDGHRFDPLKRMDDNAEKLKHVIGDSKRFQGHLESTKAVPVGMLDDSEYYDENPSLKRYKDIRIKAINGEIARIDQALATMFNDKLYEKLGNFRKEVISRRHRKVNETFGNLAIFVVSVILIYGVMAGAIGAASRAGMSAFWAETTGIALASTFTPVAPRGVMALMNMTGLTGYDVKWDAGQMGKEALMAFVTMRTVMTLARTATNVKIGKTMAHGLPKDIATKFAHSQLSEFAKMANPALWVRGNAGASVAAIEGAKGVAARGGWELMQEIGEGAAGALGGHAGEILAAVANSLDGVNINVDRSLIMDASALGIGIDMDGNFRYSGNAEEVVAGLEARTGADHDTIFESEIIQDEHGNEHIILGFKNKGGEVVKSVPILATNPELQAAEDLVLGIDQEFEIEFDTNGDRVIDGVRNFVEIEARYAEAGFIVNSMMNGKLRVTSADGEIVAKYKIDGESLAQFQEAVNMDETAVLALKGRLIDFDNAAGDLADVLTMQLKICLLHKRGESIQELLCG
ncbi:hypothetical protein JKY72_06415 [Candidatus Gracilibacteria bacterium]|nr:hypothetical protein [Candidatus Gracilibacteria bacterium]